MEDLGVLNGSSLTPETCNVEQKRPKKRVKRKCGEHPVLVLRGKSSGLRSTSLRHGGGRLSGPKLVKFDTGKVKL